MENFLRKIKLIDTLSLTLNVTKSEFITKLNKDVDIADIDTFFSVVFDIFSSSKKPYKGVVGYSDFNVRKKRNLFTKKKGNPRANGTFREQRGVLIVNVDIIGIKPIYILYYLLLFTLYISFVLNFLGRTNFLEFFSDFSTTMTSAIVTVFILLSMIIPIFSIIKSVKDFKKDLNYYFLSFNLKKTNRL